MVYLRPDASPGTGDGCDRGDHEEDLSIQGRQDSDARLTEVHWQCDAHGRYLHRADTGKRPRDTAFQGYGRMTSGADSAYQFRTIRPVAYPGRTPHTHFAVRPPVGASWSRKCM